MQHLASSPTARARAGALRAGVLAVAAIQLVTGLALALTPRAFYDAIADFGPRNEHDLRDMAAFYLASAIVLAIAAGRPSWRAPALALVGLQFALHALNHLLDVGNGDPGWIGPLDLASLALGALVLGGLYLEAVR
ncbi:MAG: hypothetical protein JWQ18_1869 [Conexibacter sp.]|nr:hypothetical protein [Conexibacter sp.]